VPDRWQGQRGSSCCPAPAAAGTHPGYPAAQKAGGGQQVGSSLSLGLGCRGGGGSWILAATIEQSQSRNDTVGWGVCAAVSNLVPFWILVFEPCCCSRSKPYCSQVPQSCCSLQTKVLAPRSTHTHLLPLPHGPRQVCVSAAWVCSKGSLEQVAHSTGVTQTRLSHSPGMP
jgi:hypothetical protein